MKYGMFCAMLFLCLNVALHAAMELTFTRTSVVGKWSDATRVTIHVKGSVLGREPSHVAYLNTEPRVFIDNFVISLGPTDGFVMWKWPDGTEAAYPIRGDVEYMLAHLKKSYSWIYEDMDISEQAGSSWADITFDSNIVELENGVSERKETITISPFENGPVQARRAYNELVFLIEAQLPTTMPLVFREVPIVWLEPAWQYLKEIPTRVRMGWW
jgi:hypothetical protein